MDRTLDLLTKFHELHPMIYRNRWRLAYLFEEKKFNCVIHDQSKLSKLFVRILRLLQTMPVGFHLTYVITSSTLHTFTCIPHLEKTQRVRNKIQLTHPRPKNYKQIKTKINLIFCSPPDFLII